MKRYVMITMAIALALTALSTVLLGCNPAQEEDPAVALLEQAQQQSGAASPATAPEAGEAAEPAEEEPEADESAEEAEEAGAEESAEDAEGAEAEEPAEDTEEPAEADGGADQGLVSDEDTAPRQMPAQQVPEESASGDEGEEAADEEAAAEESGDPVENFKNLDPRDIIVKKYEDLEERKTEPWDEESEGYLPNTGRVDPLTRVRSAVPDELKPPRAGETDMNEINTYLIADAATMIVDGVAYAMQCHNVIQIGLTKYATFSYGGSQPFPLEEGFSTSLNAGSVNGIPIVVTITLTSVSTEQVVLRITAAGQGTATSVTKNQTYIPRTAF